MASASCERALRARTPRSRCELGNRAACWARRSRLYSLGASRPSSCVCAPAARLRRCGDGVAIVIGARADADSTRAPVAGGARPRVRGRRGHDRSAPRVDGAGERRALDPHRARLRTRGGVHLRRTPLRADGRARRTVRDDAIRASAVGREQRSRDRGRASQSLVVLAVAAGAKKSRTRSGRKRASARGASGATGSVRITRPSRIAMRSTSARSETK